MLEITIDGKTCTCEKGEYLLEVARRNGFIIPTLCQHPAIGEQASCRLCLVEVIENGRSKIVVSCVYPLEKPCEVLTNSERVQKDRAVVLMLLHMRAPDSPEITALCKAYHALDGSRFKPLDGEKCVMCGLCARACASLGTGAISTVGRGTGKKVSTPYDEPSSACVGCLSCAKVCPTDAIPYVETLEEREIWGRKFPLIRCRKCGKIVGTDAELALAAQRAGLKKQYLCTDCKRKESADEFAHVFGEADFTI